MSMENKMTPEEEEFALAEANKALQYSESVKFYCPHLDIVNGVCKQCGLWFNKE